MEKLSEPRLVDVSEYDTLKELFTLCFEDLPEVVNTLFEKSVSPEKVVAVFDGERAVGSLYLLEGDIIIDGTAFSAYYVYGVCTHPDYRNKGLMKKMLQFAEGLVEDRKIEYLFLVPAEEYLFDVYSKSGFKDGICYREKTFYKENFSDTTSFAEEITYKKYRSYCFERSRSGVVIATLGEAVFKSFFFSVSGEVCVIETENGYCVFENNGGKVTVFEIFGNVSEILSVVFEKTKVSSLACRFPANDRDKCKAYGMYKGFGNVPEIENAFFGIPYST